MIPTSRPVDPNAAACIAAEVQHHPRLGSGNFDYVSADDLQFLFELYDRHYFGGAIAREIAALPHTQLTFRVSTTMTRAGGKTQWKRQAHWGRFHHYFEISISLRLLLMTFRDDPRPITVGGLVCSDRTQALLRLMEHEIVHLVELLNWRKSSCAGVRFKQIIRQFFGHTQRTHGLITPREHAAVTRGIQVGSMVQFCYKNQTHQGRVNRIGVRATILVAAVDGTRYSDGQKYHKYLLPLKAIELMAPISPK